MPGILTTSAFVISGRFSGDHKWPPRVERIFLNGDRYILVDLYLQKHMIAIGIDGSTHDLQKRYDSGRNAWLLQAYGVRTIRPRRQEVLKRAYCWRPDHGGQIEDSRQAATPRISLCGRRFHSRRAHGFIAS